MRIAFFDSVSDELTPQRKGHLLERLVQRLVARCGYADVRLRVKHSSLEYDIEGRHRLSDALLSGEAKAHDANMNGKEVAAFVGKLLPLAGRNPQVDAIFISTSPLTPDATDYLDNYPDGRILPNLVLRVFAGNDIPAFFVREGLIVNDSSLTERLSTDHHLEVFDTWLVVSDRDEFLLCTCGANLVARATTFACFSTDGRPIYFEPAQLARLQKQLPDVLELSQLGRLRQTEYAPARHLPAIAAGAGWFDYKFPAPPDCFIGREDPLGRLRRVLDEVRSGRTTIRALQILSRSGVGKSSLLLKFAEFAEGAVALTIDGRTLRAPTDLRLLGSEFIERINLQLSMSLPHPRSWESLQESFELAGASLVANGLVGVIGVDQFESALGLPQVFDAAVDLVAGLTTRRIPILLVFARKNDIAVTFDAGSLIDLGRLNQLSAPIELDDFSPAEGKALFGRLSIELGESIQPDLARAISAFSGGFPWLHKRLCAHVLTMHREGTSQRELLQAGLRADDLFQEDLAVLNQQDRALLRTLAAHLPNTANELARRLENEVTASHLTIKLNEFLATKLLRLSGDIYDTYNDVFKTYLVTDRVPFQTRYVFRVGPIATLALLRDVANVGPLDLAAFQAHVGGNPIAVLNKLRELRLLGLIEPRPGWVELTPEARSALDKNALLETIRKALRANGLVSRTLDQLAGRGELSVDDVATVLQHEMPHVEVNPKTWRDYAIFVCAWMNYSGLAQLEGERLRPQTIPLDSAPRDREFTRGTFKPGTFLPSVRPEAVLRLLQMMGGRTVSMSHIYSVFEVRSTRGILRDAESLDLIEVDGENISPGRQAKIFSERGSDFSTRDIARLALTKENVKVLLKAAAKEPLSESQQKAVLRPFGSAQWTDQTWGWRLGILRSWLTTSGQATSTRNGLSAR